MAWILVLLFVVMSKPGFVALVQRDRLGGRGAQGLPISTKPELVPLVVVGQQRPGSPAFFGGGGTQCKGLLSRQMASRSAITTPDLRVGKSSLR